MREYDVSRNRPCYAGYPTLKVYMAKFDPGWEGYPVWQTGLPALAGHSIYHVPWVPEDIFFLSILLVRLFHIRYFENGPLEPGYHHVNVIKL